jgi:hypothetical protein
MADRFATLPSGGRGTDRDIDDAEPLLVDEGPSYDRMLLCGGRGTPRFMAICDGSVRDWAGEALPMGRSPMPPRLKLPAFCGGRGTLRPAGDGIDRVCVCGACGVDDPAFRPLEVSPRAAAIWLAAALDDTAGGVMRLTVGRENAPEAGRAPELAFAPSLLSRVGFTFTRLRDWAPFKSFGVRWTEFPWTDKPCWRPFCDMALSAPGLFALAKWLADSAVLAPEK